MFVYNTRQSNVNLYLSAVSNNYDKFSLKFTAAKIWNSIDEIASQCINNDVWYHNSVYDSITSVAYYIIFPFLYLFSFFRLYELCSIFYMIPKIPSGLAQTKTQVDATFVSQLASWFEHHSTQVNASFSKPFKENQLAEGQ